LRNQATVPLYQLLRPYPQYGALFLASAPKEGDTVRNLEIRVQRSFSNGFSLLGSYLYNREWSTWWPSAADFTDGPYYYKQTPAWTDESNPAYARHRAIVSGLYDLPFGHGRQMLSHANPLIDGVLGGWSLGSILSISSGAPIVFSNGNPYVMAGDPSKNIPAGYGFNPNAFSNLPDFTPFTGPEVFPGVNGPLQWNLDANLSNSFPIRERLKLQFRI
jgi:hypothetical protein